MTDNIVSLLWRIAGRVKEMAVWFTAFGAMLIPLAFILRLEEGKSSFIFYVFLVLGFIAFIMGWVYTWKEMTQRKREMRIFANLLVSIQSALSEILKELRGNRHDRNSIEQ